jgi:hypothetical protein
MDTEAEPTTCGSYPGCAEDGDRYIKGESGKIKSDMKSLIRARHLSIRKLAAIIGLLRSTIMAIFADKHHTIPIIKQLYQRVNHPSNLSHGCDWKVKVSEEKKEAAQWWMKNLKAWNGRTMAKEVADLVIDTGASDYGWGFVARESENGEQVIGQGRWELEEK